MEATGPVAGGSVEVEGWEGGEMVLSPSSLAHGMEGVEVTEGSDEVEGWGGGEVVAGGEGERGAFCLPKGQYSGASLWSPGYPASRQVIHTGSQLEIEIKKLSFSIYCNMFRHLLGPLSSSN